MNRTISRRAADILLLMGMACAISVFLCLLAYRIDNKYAGSGPWGHNGVLTPEDFTLPQPLPDQDIFIGRYGGFEDGNYGASPYGGVDIPTAVSDFPRLYSGIVYPPAIGAPLEASDRLYASFLFRAALCACALTIGGLAVLVGIWGRKSLPYALYGLLCLLYTGYACSPLTQALMGGSRFTYAVESFSFCAMLLVFMLLMRHISGLRKTWCGLFLLFGGAISLASLVLPFALNTGNLSVMKACSTLISLYEWVAAGYITYVAIRGALQNREYIKPILCGAVIFSAALIIDGVLPLYEPVVGGWFIGLAGFIFILSVGAAIGQQVAAQYRDKAVLNERIASMEQVLFLQKKNYEALQKDTEKTKIMRHDMRHHFNMIGSFMKNGRYDDLQAYLAPLETSVAESGQEEYSANHIINILAHHYAFVSRQNGISFDFRCGVGGEIALPDTELCSLLSNLLENAVEACLKMKTGRRFICVALTQVGEIFSVHVENSCEGNLRPAKNTFLSTKGEKQSGYGLASVAAIARRHNGNADFAWNSGAGIFVSRITLNL